MTDLTTIDAFHPPSTDDTDILKYKEWHYFNIIDKNQNIYVFTTMGLSGNIYQSDKSIANNLIGYITPIKSEVTGAPFSVTESEWSSTNPNLKISINTITYLYSATENKYTIHEESSDGSTILDVTFIPLTEPSSILNAQSTIYWLVASPKMNVNGSLTVNKGTSDETTYTFINATGYHDHNWGHWLWKEDNGWTWGQLNEQIYVIAFGDFTNRDHNISMGKIINVWKNDLLIKTFNDISIQYETLTDIPEYPGIYFPKTTILNATDSSSTDNILITFTADKIKPILTRLEYSNDSRIIWELIGSYTVTGTINGEQISFTSDGYFEYFGYGIVEGEKKFNIIPIGLTAITLGVIYIILRKKSTTPA